MTLYLHRVLLLIPARLRDEAVRWWNEGVGAGEGAATWRVRLNPSGDAAQPTTHYWASSGLRAEDFAALLTRLTDAAGLTRPPDWATMTDEAQLDWVITQLEPELTKKGITLVRDDQSGEWSSADALLAAQGLQRLASPL